MSCLGDVVAALVDGELDHAARERAQRHLAHCRACRVEVDGQRRLKARLTGDAAEPAPSEALTARLLALRGEPASRATSPAPRRRGPRVLVTPPVSGAAGSAPPRSGPPTTAGRRRRRGLRRTAAVGSAVAVLGVSLVLGGSPGSGPSTPVAPGTPALVGVFVHSVSGHSTGTSSVGGARSQR